MRRHCLCTDDGGGPENENRAVFFGFTAGTGKTRNSKRQMAISNLGGIYGKRNQLPGCLPCLLSHDTTNIPPRKGQLYYVKAGDCITLEFCNQGYEVYCLLCTSNEYIWTIFFQAGVDYAKSVFLKNCHNGTF